MDHLHVLYAVVAEAATDVGGDEYVPGDFYKFIDDDIFNILNVFFGAAGGLSIAGIVLGLWYYFKAFEKYLGY